MLFIKIDYLPEFSTKPFQEVQMWLLKISQFPAPQDELLSYEKYARALKCYVGKLS